MAARKQSVTRQTKKKREFKEKTCKVIRYNKDEKTLDVDFSGYGIRIKNVESFSGDSANVKYTSEIGKPDFIYTLNM